MEELIYTPILVSLKGLNMFKKLKILSTFYSLSTEFWIEPLGIIRSIVISELELQGTRTVCPSLVEPSFSVRTTVTSSLHGTTRPCKSTASPDLKWYWPHLNMSSTTSEYTEREISSPPSRSFTLKLLIKDFRMTALFEDFSKFSMRKDPNYLSTGEKTL